MNRISLSLLSDTGSAVSVLAKEIFQRYFAAKTVLEASPQFPKNYSGRIVPVCGCFTATVIFQDHQESLLFYVGPKGRSLLGIDDISAFQSTLTEGELRCWQTTTESQSEIDQLDEVVELLCLELQCHVSELAESR